MMRNAAFLTICSLCLGLLLGWTGHATQERSERTRLEREYLALLDADLGIGIASLETAMRQTSDNLQRTDELRAWMEGEDERVSSTTLMEHLRGIPWWPDFHFPRRGYDELSRSAGLGVISDPELRRRLVVAYRSLDRIERSAWPAHASLLGAMDRLNEGAWHYVFRPVEKEEEGYGVQFQQTLASLLDDGFSRYLRGELRELDRYEEVTNALHREMTTLRQDLLDLRRQVE